MSGLHPVDWTILIVYFIAIVLIGINESRKIKNSGDYFLPNKFGKFFMMMFSFGTGTHADQAVGVASKSFTSGLSGMWYQWLYLPVTPFYWLIAPIFRRCRAITTSDVYHARYNFSVGILFAVVGTLSMVVALGLMLKGSTEVLTGATGGQINPRFIICLVTALFVTYGVFGGLSAAILIDFIQGVFIIAFSFMLLPMLLNNIGGLSGLKQGLPDPQLFKIVAPKDIGIFYVLIMAFNGLVGIVGQPQFMSNCAAGKTELEGRFGLMGGNFLKRLCTIPWSLIGVAAIVYFAGRNVPADRVFGTVAHEFLNKVLPGLLGIFVAGVVSSVMSSCSAMMISTSALFTENIYKPLMPNKTKGHYIAVGRILCIAVVGAALVFALSLPEKQGVIKGLEIFMVVPSTVGIVFWLGLFWRKATSAGAWAATITSMIALSITWTQGFVDFLSKFPVSQTAHFIVASGAGFKLSYPWQIIFFIVPGFLAGIIVSLFTKPVPKEQLDKFYALIRTPIAPNEVITAPCTLPAGVAPAPRRNLIPSKNFEIMVPTKQSIVGFLAGWGIVAALIGFVYLLTKL